MVAQKLNLGAGPKTSRSTSPEVFSEPNCDSDQASDAYSQLSSDGSRKRRRLSPRSSEEPIQSLPTQPTSILSRVKAKKNGILTVPLASSNDAAGAQAGTTTFASLNVQPWLISSLSAMAITRPTGIQKGCIPKILEGRDCIGGSRTGSGKTVAFAVPILQKWAEDPVGIFGVVLTPTR